MTKFNTAGSITLITLTALLAACNMFERPGDVTRRIETTAAPIVITTTPYVINVLVAPATVEGPLATFTPCARVQR